MPSKARQNFESYPLKDIDLLMETHREWHTGKGKPYTVLTRSGIFLLCAAFELFCEEIIRESVFQIVKNKNHPNDLCDNIKKSLAAAAKSDKNELAVLRLSGDGWKDYYIERTNLDIQSLNTPSSKNIVDLFKKLTDIDVSSVFSPIDADLDKFIKKRGDIAHKGSRAGHVSMKDLEADYEFICGVVSNLDNYLIEPLLELSGTRPWYRRDAE